MNFITALNETRPWDQGYSTIFYNGNIKVSPRRIDTSKKRRKQNEDVVEAPAAGKQSAMIWNS